MPIVPRLVRQYSTMLKVTLPTLLPAAPEDSKSHHNGTIFRNPWTSFLGLPSPLAFLRAYWSGEFKMAIALQSDIEKIGSQKPAFKNGTATWLGHACFYVEMDNGIRLLFDPVFSNRCSPSQRFGPKRFTQPPCHLKDIPQPDIVAISHNHYDHLDVSTIQNLNKLYPNVHFFVPLGLKSWMQSLKIENITELDWWDARDITTANNKTGQISCLPAQHMTARGFLDRYHTLWASWSFESGGKKIWFAGDTGYRTHTQSGTSTVACPVFKSIGRLRGPFDLAMIPIGAYKPRHLLSSVHVDPSEAVEIFEDIKAKKAIGMHWGTFALSSEDILEPRDELQRIAREKNIDFDTVVLGGFKDI